MTLTTTDLARLAELERAAAPAPWTADYGEKGHEEWFGDGLTTIDVPGRRETPVFIRDERWEIDGEHEDDGGRHIAALILEARNALPHLLVDLREARALLAATVDVHPRIVEPDPPGGIYCFFCGGEELYSDTPIAHTDTCPYEKARAHLAAAGMEATP